MKDQISNGKCQKLLIAIIILLFVSAGLVYAAGKGTLVIPQRPPAPPPPPAEKTDPLSDEVKRVQSAYAKIRDLKGSFTQKSYIHDLEETQEYRGTFYIKKPSQMMWEYAAPRDEKVIVQDEQTLIYKKSQNQVIKTKFSRDAYSQAPIAMLADLQTIDRDFDITIPGENALQLMPRRKMGFIKKLVVETTRQEMPLKMLTIFDTYGNIIMIEISETTINPGLDDAIFTFTIPPDAEVYDMNQ